MYDDVQAALAEAKAGDTITVFGKDNAGFTVTTDDLTIAGDPGATVKDAVVLQGVDGVSVKGLTITPGSVGGQIAGIYLNDVTEATIADNTIQGTSNAPAAGIINEIGGADEVATISGNTLRDLQQGVYANPSAKFTIDGNEFRNNVAGSANDAPSTLTDNRFVNNDEGIGLGVAGSTVTGNSFANNAQDHVGDYTTDKSYDLAKIIEANTFDEEVVVTPDDQFIKDKS
jgi:nitrous oxidase accessory protein NosD